MNDETIHAGPGDVSGPRSPAAPPAPSARRNGCLTVLFVLGSIGGISLLLALVFGIPAFKRFEARAKTAEAHWHLSDLARTSCEYYEQNGQFPASAAAHPATVPARNEPVTTTDWDANATWRALEFETLDPHYFQYQYDASGSGAGAQFTASAFADLDGDGVHSTFVRTGFVGESGCQPDPAGLQIEGELE